MLPEIPAHSYDGEAVEFSGLYQCHDFEGLVECAKATGITMNAEEYLTNITLRMKKCSNSMNLSR